ncbi:hypothetical protein BOX15_Mlig028187g2 [Macrostomum lignano]|uniref:PI3K/PI4K domain-containing protein n=2 Tax=Macrostomum lignano TaxID=282301 RepID=A0A1I8HCT3_9PLAT|nr:hypothetical protein BOX15_Mlig028187g2 [Macrostomum lignano]
MQLGTFQLYSEASAADLLATEPDLECQVEHTGRLILPDRLLHRLAACQPPFLFRLSTASATVHLGYPVFRGFRPQKSDGISIGNALIAPAWAAKQLSNADSSLTADTQDAFNNCRAVLSIVALPTGSFIRLQPMQPDEVFGWTNPTATLNKKLRDFACLSVGCVFSILYIDKTFHFEVKSLKPAEAVCIIDCDMQLEFDFSSNDPAQGAGTSQDDRNRHDDVVLNDDRLLRCGVSTKPAVSADPTDSDISAKPQPTDPAPRCSDLLRDALGRARESVNAASRRWGSGVELASGQTVGTSAPLLPPAEEAKARKADPVPNLSYLWGSLNFLRPVGRVSSDQDAARSAVDAQDSFGAGRGVRLKDSLTPE